MLCYCVHKRISLYIPKVGDGLMGLDRAETATKALWESMVAAKTAAGLKVLDDGAVVINNGKHWAQSLGHLHLHVLGGNRCSGCQASKDTRGTLHNICDNQLFVLGSVTTSVQLNEVYVHVIHSPSPVRQALDQEWRMVTLIYCSPSMNSNVQWKTPPGLFGSEHRVPSGWNELIQGGEPKPRLKCISHLRAQISSRVANPRWPSHSEM